jgi:serine protease Do
VKRLTVAAAESKAERVARTTTMSASLAAASASRCASFSPEERRGNRGKGGGLLVEDVGGAAERAGVQAGDVVVAFNGTPVKTPEELRDLVAKSGKSVALLIQREGRRLFVPIELG